MWVRRLMLSLKIQRTGGNGIILFGRKIDAKVNKNARILVGGRVQIGMPLSEKTHFSALERTCLYLGDGAILEFHGRANIAPGVSIIVGNGAHLSFGDGVIIAHNTQIICNYRIDIGTSTMISWNSTLIDFDDHHPVTSTGKTLRLQKRALLIGDRVGMQANVLIPRGITVGSGSVISAGTVLREDVPSETFLYSEQKLRKKAGLTSGIK
jgi:acetyltransferase-like isoleucine patch superfamily enzyme